MSATDDLDLARYAQSRHLPAMRAGFTVHTNYGDLDIRADEIAAHPEVWHGVAKILAEREDTARAALDTAP